jgi:uncharacterized protein YkwD
MPSRMQPPFPPRRCPPASRAAWVITLALAIAGCGGGGDGGAAAAATTPPSNDDADALATCGLANFQSEVLQRVNARRASGGSCRTEGNFPASPALQWNASLDRAAAGHSQDMAAKNYFSHTGADGRSVGDRAGAQGYAWRTVGENIAAGYPSVQAVIDGWMASDGHCRNILNPAFRDIGVACVRGAAGNTYPNYWTMVLGAQ